MPGDSKPNFLRDLSLTAVLQIVAMIVGLAIAWEKIGGQQAVTNAKIDNLSRTMTDQFSDMRQDIAELKATNNDVVTRVGRVEVRVAEHSLQIDSQRDDIRSLQTRLYVPYAPAAPRRR